MDSHENRIVFLREFTEELISNSKPHLGEKEGEEVMEAGPLLEIKPLEDLPLLTIKPEPVSQPKPIPRSVQQSPRMPVHPALAKPTIKPPIQPMQQVPGFEKIKPFLSDPKVDLIECTGPGKFVLARVNGRTTITRTNLNKNEIQSIIEDFSKRTKIPIIEGIFKAASGNLLITAVVSDLVGSRFLISKILQQPTQQTPPPQRTMPRQQTIPSTRKF